MSRKRDGDGAHWGNDRALRIAADGLVDADDQAIASKAAELGADERRLRAFVLDARRRKQPAPG